MPLVELLVVEGGAKEPMQACLASPSPPILCSLAGALVRAGEGVKGALDTLTRWGQVATVSRAWEEVAAITSPRDHLACAVGWLEFAAIHLSSRHLNKLVVAAVRRVREGGEWEGRDAMLATLLRGLLSRMRWHPATPATSPGAG